MAEQDVFVGDYRDASQPIETWWADAHTRKDLGWLSGTVGDTIWRSLAISSRVLPDREVLNIGVGLGTCTRDLVAAGCKVSALDICPIALDRVRDVVQGTYLTADIDRLPDACFDLAISHLVAQHMFDADLETQIRHVLRALKPGGVFAMQFSYGWGQETSIANETLDNAKAGGVTRTLSHMVDMVDRLGGQVTRAHVIDDYPQYRTGWYALHIAHPRI